MRTAVVVGAGIGGLAVAGALARSGWQVTLLERGDRLRAEQTALVLWPNGVRALGALGLGDGLDAIATALPDVGVRRPDGHWLVQPRPMVDERAPVVVHREDLHDALIAGLGDRVEIRTGVRVRTVRTSAADRPAVGDGRTEWEADLVVAADGVDSVVRQRLAPEATVVSSGSAAWRAVIPWYRAPKLPADQSVNGETLGAGYRFVAISLGERGSSGGSTRGGIYWVATAAGASRPESPETQLALLRRWYANWPAPIGDLLAATEPEDLVQQEVRELRPLPRGFAFPSGPGGVVLLGDAAHAMPHHLGQGACLAFEDAATLRSAVRDAVPGESLRGAVEAYNRARRPRAVTVVRQTRRMSAVLQSRGRLALRARDAALGTITPRLMGSAATAAAAWRPPA
ncbi:2-polyprenyl-6-methoxyphenol hydroxylase-like FAD-dependent oxidoreductase [Micromonospora pisi]|uniref:2-polyprenyl-6-methoxyphenol hydroxylase-like FAD-dependent oxidoreductase n=1 Tax=Micromonospora pisi TaxID=589240 RepID=A0A495JE02_9ACTN|nr:NAD(P)/FAD-dependent oxidoreductase [Micromonospora pisi]RKR87135.1 2-polyprenyl-6-methoxyphenol hydroxylase-like FAD-dependent oxidoreductase [Micromonospora pisi]